MKPNTLFRCFALAALTATFVTLSSCAFKQYNPPPPPPPVGVFDGEGGSNDAGSSRDYSPSSSPLARAKVDERPGLGTTAGSERYSRVQDARFLRKSDAPDAVDSFHYNDEKGAKAMVEILGGSTSKHDGLFSAAGERLKMGLVRYGTPYPRYEAKGRRIVIGEAGSHYEVRLENRSKKRLLVVLSVDGLNVITNKPASPTQEGYILDPKDTCNVDGFRKDSNTVRTFQFGSVAASQAAKKGGAGNVGVIGLAVFEEDEARARMELKREQFVRDGATAFPGQ
ncbi:MAG: hypothetical protein ACO1TE_11295 [Prosthecobacter sp.]